MTLSLYRFHAGIEQRILPVRSYFKGGKMLGAIRKIAKKHAYAETDHQENIYMVSFRKNDIRINVYYSKMTIATCLNHPRKGKTQLFRRGVWDLKLLENIFAYPRVHTKIGYYKA
jgi:hypothetical protein